MQASLFSVLFESRSMGFSPCDYLDAGIIGFRFIGGGVDSDYRTYSRLFPVYFS